MELIRIRYKKMFSGKIGEHLFKKYNFELFDITGIIKI